MASTMQKPVKQLGDLLQEQQEPFVLESYLFERGYLRKSSSNKEGCSRCCNGNSSKSFNRSSSWGLNKNKKDNLSCSKILRSVYNKLVSRHSGPSNKSSSENKERNSQEIGESDRFSSASSRTQYDSCFEGDQDEVVSWRNDHDPSLTADTSQVLKPCNMKERKIELFNRDSSKSRCRQQIPLSVIEDKPSHADASSPLHRMRKLHAMSREEDSPCPSTGNSILSASLLELLFHPALEKPRGSGFPEKLEPVMRCNSPSPHLTKSKRVLQQTRKLLFDCVREMTETHAKKEEQQQQKCKSFLGAEEIGKLIYEKIGTWSKQGGDEGNINFLSELELDLVGSAEEWNNNDQEKREIGLEIGDAILEEIIKETVYEQ